ncbi:hypothetical protein BK141_25830 [Paenibacillus sp. FSL R5-0765]|nr:hypothetical protein BK141_25830 [Paenibacillus sp. FSL R5-0765]
MQEELTEFVRATYGTPFLTRKISILFPDDHFPAGNGSFRKEVDYKEQVLDGDVYLPLYIECDQHI